MWVGIADDLRGKIEGGEYAPGDRLPSEDDLAATYGVHRTTARKALVKLTGEGLLDQGKGRRGRRVRNRKPLVYYAMKSESPERIAHRKALGLGDAWSADVTDQGGVPGQSIAVAIEEADPQIAARLEIPDGSSVVVRRRLRTIDGEPHNQSDTYHPYDIAGGTPIEHPADVKQGTIALLAELGWPQDRFRDEIAARVPTPDESRRLQIPAGEAVLMHYRTGYSAGRPIKVAVTIWPGDRAGLEYGDGE